MSLLLIEAAKVRRVPGILIALLGPGLILVLYLLTSVSSERDLVRALDASMERIARPELVCDGRGRCLDDVFRESPAARETFVRQIDAQRTAVSVAQAEASVAGAVPLVAGAMGSAVGAIAASLLGVLIVGLDLSNRTLPLVFVRRPRRWDLLLAKCLLTLILFIVACAIALAAVMLSAALITGRSGQAELLGAPGLQQQLSVVVINGTFFGSVAVGTAFLIRAQAAALAMIVGVLAIDLFMRGVVPPFSRWSVSFNLWSIGAGFHSRVTQSSNSYWTWPSMLGQPRALLVAGAYLLALAAMLGVSAGWRLRSDESD